MKIRRYLGSNTQEAILKVKMDLGNEAIILNTRKVRKKGLFSIFSKPMIEVLAAIDEDFGKKKDIEQLKREEAPKAIIRENKAQTLEKQSFDKNILDKKEEKISELENKVSSMETLLQKIYTQIKNPEIAEEIAEDEEKPVLSNVMQLFHKNLLKNEVDVELTEKIIDMAKSKMGDNPSVNETASLLYNIITGMLGKPETIKLKEDGKPAVIIFIGPTGVGKTTTLAKIAASFALNMKKNVGMITADTYRIAAVEQLKTYAEILGMPVSIIYSATEIKDAINAYADKDVILIDTAGRSHRNRPQFEELKTLVKASEADEVYLVLSATTSLSNCREILKNYDFLNDYKIIFTKLDEAPVAGIILNTRASTNKSLSYITTGQSVPDDIEVLNVDKITKNILGSIT